MNNAGDLTPPVPVPAPAPAPAASAPSWLHRHRLPLIAGGAVLAIGATSVSAALVLLAKPVSTVEKMVPADADVLVIANLDPSVSQKLNLLRVIHRFPDTSNDKAIADLIDQAFKGTGLSYRNDIQPWLGAEVGISAKLNYDSSALDTTAAVYALSRDDARAKASLAGLRSNATGKKLQWHDETYSGFTVSIGTPLAAADKAAAYSYVDHVVVLATSAAAIHSVIDTEQGRAPRLVDSANFKATVAGLPSDRIGLAYVNGTSVVAGVKKQLAKAPTSSKPVTGNLAELDAFLGLGATLSATDKGIKADLLVKLDQSKLSASSRKALTNPGHADAVLSWVPKGSDAVLAVGNLNQTIQSLLDASQSDKSIKADTDAIGLTGPGGVLQHLTGDAGLEARLPFGSTPSGALLLRTDDTASLSAFFGKLLGLSNSLSGLVSPSPSTGRVPAAAPRTVRTTYRGVSITSLSVPSSLQLVFAPSYAVVDGMGILGSNLAEVKAVIDAHQSGSGMGTDPTYKLASAGSVVHPTALIYLNTGDLLQALRHLGQPSVSKALDDKAVANLTPVKAIMLTASSQADQAVERIFVLID